MFICALISSVSLLVCVPDELELASFPAAPRDPLDPARLAERTSFFSVFFLSRGLRSKNSVVRGGSNGAKQDLGSSSQSFSSMEAR